MTGQGKASGLAGHRNASSGIEAVVVDQSDAQRRTGEQLLHQMLALLVGAGVGVACLYVDAGEPLINGFDQIQFQRAAGFAGEPEQSIAERCSISSGMGWVELLQQLTDPAREVEHRLSARWRWPGGDQRAPEQSLLPG